MTVKNRRKQVGAAGPACKGCMYQGYLYSENKNLRTCDYLLITGQSRPCPPGAGCTVKKLVNGRARRRAAW